MVNVIVNLFFGISFFLEVANLVNVAQCIMQIWSSSGKVTLKEVAF